MANQKTEEELKATEREPDAEQSAEIEHQATKLQPMANQEIETEQATELKPVGTYIFIEPVKFEGETYTERPYDLKGLKSTDVMQQMRLTSRVMGNFERPDSPMTDTLLHAALFAKAADLPVEFLPEMGASDFLAWASAAQGFFARALRSLVR